MKIAIRLQVGINPMSESTRADPNKIADILPTTFSNRFVDENPIGRWMKFHGKHYNGIITRVMAPQIISLPTVYLGVYSGVDQRKHQSSASLAFVRGIHLWLMNSPHKKPVTRKKFPFDDVIMEKDVIQGPIRWLSARMTYSIANALQLRLSCTNQYIIISLGSSESLDRW